jgi:polar amino acid transport system substrate-binding protein
MNRLIPLLMALCAALPALALEVTTEDNPPFNYLDEEKHVGGLSTEILLEMGRRASVPMNVRLLPWAQAYQYALGHPGSCVYSTVRLPQREASFKWVGPLSTNKWALFAKNDFAKPIATLDDAKPYRIGGVTMDAKAVYLQSHGFTHVELVSDDRLNQAKLISGYIDLWITGIYRGTAPTDPVTSSKAIKPVFIVREVDYFLACHPQTPEATLRALEQALQTLRKEGFVKEVTARYASRMQQN